MEKVPKKSEKEESSRLLEGEVGVRLSLYTGMLERGFTDRWSTLHFYHAYPGDKIVLSDMKYEFAVATYSLEREPVYLYTYSYQEEENWTTYNHDLKPESYGQKEYLFDDECYFRVNLKRKDGNRFNEEDEKHLSKALTLFSATRNPDCCRKECFENEIKKTAKEVEKIDGMKFVLMADSHYVVNGTWEDTICNIKSVAKRTCFDGIIHLGDFTDGMVSRQVNRDYVNHMIKDLKSLHVPIYIVLGNHDSNYFRNNQDKFSYEEQQQIYLKQICREEKELYYYQDIEKIKTRFFFLHSFDYQETVRYGFSNEELKWFEKELNCVPNGYRVLVFSHVPPLPQIHYWSKEIRNGEKMVEILESYSMKPGKKVLGWIHGHNHADAVYRDRMFPIISIGCNKCEYYPDKKPEGAFAWERFLDEVSQDLWDILIIGKEDTLNFIRFGAGENRTLRNI